MDPEQLLLALSTKEHLQSHEYAEEIKVDPQVVIGCIKSIQSHGENIIEVSQTKIDVIKLTEEGEKVVCCIVKISLIVNCIALYFCNIKVYST